MNEYNELEDVVAEVNAAIEKIEDMEEIDAAIDCIKEAAND